MKISTTQYFKQSTQQMGDLQASLAKTQEQLASKKQIIKPSDAPDQAASITRLQSVIARQKSYQETLKSVDVRLTAEETALTSGSDVMAKIKELATLAANDTVGAQDRTSIALQIRTLRDQMLSLANSQDANGNYLFSGSKADTPSFAKNSDGTVSYQGDQARMQVNVGDNRRVNLNLPGSDVFTRVVRTDSQGNKQGVDFFQSLADLADAVESSNHSGMQRGIAEVDTLATGISEGLGQIGADMTVVDMQTSVLDAVLLRLNNTKSSIEDLDYAEAATRLSQQSLALQAAQSGFAKISQLSLFQYLR